jgi:hypothetical protein
MDAQIGLIHQWMTWSPKEGTNPIILRLLTRPICKFLNDAWANTTTMMYFITGEFIWRNHLGADIVWRDPIGRPGLDFIGLNYYTR